MNKLKEAHQKWLTSDEKTRGRFNVKWLMKNGYSGIYQWSEKHGGIKDVISKASEGLRSDFEYRERSENYTSETAVSKFEEAHQEWLTSDEKTRGRFNMNWVINNGYSGLYAWIVKHGGIEDLASRASEGLRSDFNYEVKRRGIKTGPLVDLAQVSLEELTPRIAYSGRSVERSEDPDWGEERGEPNELQRLRFDIGRALKSGNWNSELIDKYIKFHSYLPDFLYHHLAVNDVKSKVEKGLIEMPKTVLSVAGGAYGEAIAWHRLIDAGDRPALVTMDLSGEMLDRAKPALEEKYQMNDTEFVNVRADMKKLKSSVLTDFQRYDFDLIECGALDNLNSESEVLSFVEEALDLLKKGQSIRLLSKKPFDERVYKMLDLFGAVLLSPKGGILKNKSVAGDNQLSARVKEKLAAGRFYLFAKLTESGERQNLEKNVAINALEEVSELPPEELKDALAEIISQYPRLKEIPVEELNKAGFTRKILRKAGRKHGEVVVIEKIG